MRGLIIYHGYRIGDLQIPKTILSWSLTFILLFKLLKFSVQLENISAALNYLHFFLFHSFTAPCSLICLLVLSLWSLWMGIMDIPCMLLYLVLLVYAVPNGLILWVWLQKNARFGDNFLLKVLVTFLFAHILMLLSFHSIMHGFFMQKDYKMFPPSVDWNTRSPQMVSLCRYWLPARLGDASYYRYHVCYHQNSSCFHSSHYKYQVYIVSCIQGAFCKNI